MKIGILTFHHSLNCGAALQAWALQSYLRKNGWNACIINYGKIGWPKRFYIRLDSLRHCVGTVVNNVRTFLQTLFIESYRRMLYKRFMRDYMELNKPVDLQTINRIGFTHMIVGSDQVWHPILNEGDPIYFLDGIAPGVKRISYAPSFGTDSFEPPQEVKMTEWLKRFDALSVREPHGADIVKRLCTRCARVVCDPTLLLVNSDYESLEARPKGLPSRYVAVYTVCGHPWAERAAMVLGRALGVPVVHLPGGQFARWYFPNRRVRRVSALGPSEWLWFVHHADLVITNSFHGTVFSLLYHRPFLVALNRRVNDERLTTLLSGTGLENRAIAELEEVSADFDIDWSKADARLEELKAIGKTFLHEALS